MESKQKIAFMPTHFSFVIREVRIRRLKHCCRHASSKLENFSISRRIICDSFREQDFRGLMKMFRKRSATHTVSQFRRRRYLDSYYRHFKAHAAQPAEADLHTMESLMLRWRLSLDSQWIHLVRRHSSFAISIFTPPGNFLSSPAQHFLHSSSLFKRIITRSA